MTKIIGAEPQEPNEDNDPMIDAFETLLANLGMPEREFQQDPAQGISAKKEQLFTFVQQIKDKYPSKFFSILINRIGKYSATWANYPVIREDIFIPLLEKITQLMKQANEQE